MIFKLFIKISMLSIQHYRVEIEWNPEKELKRVFQELLNKKSQIDVYLKFSKLLLREILNFLILKVIENQISMNLRENLKNENFHFKWNRIILKVIWIKFKKSNKKRKKIVKEEKLRL